MHSYESVGEQHEAWAPTDVQAHDERRACVIEQANELGRLTTHTGGWCDGAVGTVAVRAVVVRRLTRARRRPADAQRPAARVDPQDRDNPVPAPIARRLVYRHIAARLWHDPRGVAPPPGFAFASRAQPTATAIRERHRDKAPELARGGTIRSAKRGSEPGCGREPGPVIGASSWPVDRYIHDVAVRERGPHGHDAAVRPREPPWGRVRDTVRIVTPTRGRALE
jgi:hypothetical protein